MNVCIPPWWASLSPSIDLVKKEYHTWGWMFKKPYNHDHTSPALDNDNESFRLDLVARGNKKFFSSLFFAHTRNIFKDVKNIDNLCFSELAARTQSNVLSLWSDDVTRYIVSIDCQEPCGHIIGTDTFDSCTEQIFGWTGRVPFSCYNNGSIPRIVLLIDIIK